MAGQLTIDTLSASSGVLATQNGMTGVAKAWVNFTSTATPSISGSFNVSSVTYSATGIYTIAFTTAMPSANYAPVTGANYNNASGSFAYGAGFYSLSTNSFVAQSYVVTGASLLGANGAIYIAVFGA